MELIQDFTKELTLGAIFLALIVSTIKGVFSKLVKLLWKHLKNLCQHLRKQQKLYYITITFFSTLFVVYSVVTVKKEVDVIRSKFDKYDNLKKIVSNGDVAREYSDLLKVLKKGSIKDFLVLENDKTIINFPLKKTWENSHLTNTFGIVTVDREQNKVYFQYKSVVGKNKYSNDVLYTESYRQDNPKLFKGDLILAGRDKEAFLSGLAEKCMKRPLQINLKNMEESYEYQVCDFKDIFFYATGRTEGHDQKTFNEINNVYYITVPYASQGRSVLYFYYAFNSDTDIIFDSTIHDILLDFLRKINEYKKKVKNYENLNKSS
tara:strand:- start:4351 stop:5310 length:960 start_codon:yes stop_codon:yes gene_type:complete